ncbi:hypothetical protein MCOR04_008232 [Pyricularia oryzae]|nr:hypothetical protein MCOR04_008232 [Pyricularia oryzae]
MRPRARTVSQIKERSFATRRAGLVNKARQLNQKTGAKTAILGIYNGKFFYYDSTSVLSDLGIMDKIRGEKVESPSAEMTSESCSISDTPISQAFDATNQSDHSATFDSPSLELLADMDFLEKPTESGLAKREPEKPEKPEQPTLEDTHFNFFAMFSNENHSPVADKLPKTQDLDSDVIDWGLDFTRAAAIVKMQPTFTLYMLTSLVICHSWVEQVMRIALNGTIVGPVGYMRGYFGRNDPGFVDRANTYLLPPNGRSKGVILNSDGICSPSQKIGNYSPKYPMLSAAPGDFVALRYQENGHVSLPGNGPLKPENRGTIYVYGTSEPDDNHKLLDIYRKWTAGRDKGRLIATRPFNDGQCYQINNGDISVKRQNHVRKIANDPQGADLWC